MKRRRQLMLAGLTAFAFLLFAFIVATLAAPESAPLLQIGETEPNDSFGDADSRPELPAPGYASGVVSKADPIDYYRMTTQVGGVYQATLNILGTTGGMDMSIRLYDAAQGLIDADDEEIQWTAYTTTYYARVEALLVITDATQTGQYRLDIDKFAPTPTPTRTPIPTSTSTPTPTPIPSVSEQDNYEDNDGFNAAYSLPVATSITLSTLDGVANFYPEGKGDEDWFKIWAKDDKWYQVTTSELSGVDTHIEIRDDDNDKVESDDDGAGGYASQVVWKAKYNGYYYIRVRNKVDTTGSYNMSIQETDEPAAEPTSTPGAAPEGDGCEYNGDFDNACVIAANDAQTYDFAPPYGSDVDNDYFKLWIKPGFTYECATSFLDAGVDPNIIVYDQNRNGIGGNDDVEQGDLNSYFAYYATYEGWLYLLLGYGDRTPSDVNQSNYTLECKMLAPGESTATPGPAPSDTPAPGATAEPLIPTVTPFAGLTIRPLTTPTPVPATTAEPRFVPVSLLIYYDGNSDSQPGAGEGVAGISAQAYEAATNQLLAQGFTDGQGNLEFTVASQGPVRVSVPFFGFSQLVAGEGASIFLRVPFQPLPGGAP